MRALLLIVLSVLVVAATLYALGYKAFVLDAVTWAPSARAHTHDWAQVPPAVRKWFQDQRVPGGPEAGKSCCNTSDGAYAEEDIREGGYWTRCSKTIRLPDGSEVPNPCPIKDWMRVPDEAVIHDPNRNGAPVVWWFLNYEADGKTVKPRIRCYAPGGGV